MIEYPAFLKQRRKHYSMVAGQTIAEMLEWEKYGLLLRGVGGG